jgi:formate/nitrite transporter FocA (FNT family)
MPAETKTPSVNAEQEAEAEELRSTAPKVIHEAVRKSGQEELERSVSALGWSGLAAGLSMGFSFVAEALLRANLPEASWRPLISKLGYSLGFLIVIAGRQQLFTENTLTAVIPLLTHPTIANLGRVLRLWTVVLIANIAGAHLFAWVVAQTPTFRPDIQENFRQLATEAINVGFGAAVLRGIFAGWLIALLVWLVAATKNSPVPIIVILTYIVGLGELTHVIAGSTEVLYLVMTGEASWWRFLSGYMIPALIGNIIGGVALVSALNHAQVVAGE